MYLYFSNLGEKEFKRMSLYSENRLKSSLWIMGISVPGIILTGEAYCLSVRNKVK